jgi:hypothetical protein
MCTDAYRDALTRDLSSTASSAPALGASSGHQAAEAGREGIVRRPVGADNAVSARGLRILVEEAAEPAASSDADVIAGDRRVGPAFGWSLAQGPVRPVGLVVIDPMSPVEA